MSSRFVFLLVVSIVVFQRLSVAKSRKQNLVTLREWCLAKPVARAEQLQANIDFGCGAGMVDCSPIQPGGVCFEPNELLYHASYVMNAYFQKHGRSGAACDFTGTGTITLTNPSYDQCVYPS